MFSSTMKTTAIIANPADLSRCIHLIPAIIKIIRDTAVISIPVDILPLRISKITPPNGKITAQKNSLNVSNFLSSKIFERYRTIAIFAISAG